jgi:alpha-ketoglutarate-dependent taurine dioxygenase
MRDEPTAKPALKKAPSFERRRIKIEESALVAARPLWPDKTLPLLIEPAVDGIDLISWASRNRAVVEAGCLKHGALLFRGFNLRSADNFERFVKAVSGEPLEYNERSSPRTLVGGRIYTSTEYPADQGIFPHNENSYQSSFPMKLFFFCHTPAREGGETPIADCRKVFQHLAPAIRERFIEKRVLYVRNYGGGCGLSWQTAFQTSDKAEVERYCAENGIEARWREGGRLQTRQVRNVAAKHPHTGEFVWFNHATFFHVSSLEPTVREALMAQFKEEELPNNTYYGDGSAIEPSTLDALRQAYRHETVSFPWREGDLLMLDNMLAAHGRAPYRGERRVMVGMAEPMRWNDLDIIMSIQSLNRAGR